MTNVKNLVKNFSHSCLHGIFFCICVLFLTFFAGNAFRIAYASQIQDEHYTPKENSYPAFRTSRSADSLLSPDVLNGTPEDFGIGNSKIS